MLRKRLVGTFEPFSYSPKLAPLWQVETVSTSLSKSYQKKSFKRAHLFISLWGSTNINYPFFR